MFLKSLIISSPQQVIREIKFHKGLNLIVDESEHQITGNNIGKTTVLKLIDFCLGADPKHIYIDPESRKHEYKVVRDFLVLNKVVISLVLTSDLDKNIEEVKIERNFLAKKDGIRRINGENCTEVEFEEKLKHLLFPEHLDRKPSFRQIISHNIRYRDESINNTLKTLSSYTSEIEYETLYLYLFGCKFDKGEKRQEITTQIKQEELYKKRLEKEHTKTAYESALALIDEKIERLNQLKSCFNLNENFEKELDNLTQIKYKINQISSSINKLNIRKTIIQETVTELNTSKSDIDLQQLELIYQQATSKTDSIHKSFSDLVSFHNTMIDEKARFISRELPTLEKSITQNHVVLNQLLEEEKRLSFAISKSESFDELESLIAELTNAHQKKGEYEHIIQQISEVENNIKEGNKQLETIDEELFCDSFEQIVKTQLHKFNKYFASISRQLYGEEYAIKYDITSNNKGQKLYKFSAFHANMSSGKKQGEISCFDLAYTLFADEEKISCLHFLLNDKKELMHDNQLSKIAAFVNANNIQFVASILKDKLPPNINHEEYFVLKLSQNDKLFKIGEEV